MLLLPPCYGIHQINHILWKSVDKTNCTKQAGKWFILVDSAIYTFTVEKCNKHSMYCLGSVPGSKFKKNGRNFIDHLKPKTFTNFVNFSIFLVSSNILTLLMESWWYCFHVESILFGQNKSILVY